MATEGIPSKEGLNFVYLGNFLRVYWCHDGELKFFASVEIMKALRMGNPVAVLIYLLVKLRNRDNARNTRNSRS